MNHEPLAGVGYPADLLTLRLSTLQLNTAPAVPSAAPATLRLLLLPPDLLLREATAIFALAGDDVQLVAVSEQVPRVLTAVFSLRAAAVHVHLLLDRRAIFGPQYPPVVAELDTESPGSATAEFGRPPLGSQRLRFRFDANEVALPASAPLDAGKSLLLMEAQNDAREYEQLVRGDPWGPVQHRPLITPPNVEWSTRPQQRGFYPSQGFEEKEPVPDLSLLARVPPPANPADQNPPCNTLYVGNLPPDATEAELRALFMPQKGFRRLLFRTKNGSASGTLLHSHGPMCFVEFEDVAHATRALAELYGLALPRPGGGGKGGIRLSFSKNPLGVRGPGNPRRTLTGGAPGGVSGNGGYTYGYKGV